MKYMFATDVHGSAYYCRKMLEAYDEEKAERLVLLLLLFLKIFFQLMVWNVYCVPDMSLFVGDRIPEIYDNGVTALHIIIQHFGRDSFDLKHGKISPLFAILYGSFCRNVPLYVWKREKAIADFFPLFSDFFLYDPAN